MGRGTWLSTERYSEPFWWWELSCFWWDCLRFRPGHKILPPEAPEPVVPGPNNQCLGATLVETITGTGNQRTPRFPITGDSFRVNRVVAPAPNADPKNVFLGIIVNDSDGKPVTTISQSSVGTESSIVNEEPGTFFLSITSASANYAITIEDCTGAGNGGNDNGGGSGSANNQYIPDVEVTNVINIPDKKLPPTGGPPLLVIFFSVVAGAGLLTAVVRRRY